MRRYIRHYMIIILSAYIYVLLFSPSTSPLYDFKTLGYDSYIFQTIGKYWNKQCVPYTGLFDHKGPMIFFINKVGYMLTGNRYGIFLIQIVSMSFVIDMIVKMLRQVFSKNAALLVTTVSMVGFLSCYEYGNLTEEYILPFLMGAFWQFWTWSNGYMTEQHIEHKPISAFIYGVTFGVAVMTRINNAIGICFIVLFISVTLIKEKMWKNLFNNVYMFGGGVLLVVVPFCIYFAMHNALHEMWFGTIIFNISYVESTQGFFAPVTLKRVIQFLVFFLSCYSMMFVGMLVWTKRERRYIGAFMIMLSAVTTVMFIKGRCYLHYNMICLPYFVINIIEIKKIQDAQMNTRMARGAIVILLLVSIIVGVNNIKSRYMKWFQTEEFNGMEQIVSLIPDDERDCFIAWSCPAYLYLKCDIKPFYKYFILQDSHAKVNDGVREDIQETFGTGNAKWILVKDGTQEIIQDILESRYTRVKVQADKNENLLLYQQNEQGQ